MKRTITSLAILALAALPALAQQETPPAQTPPATDAEKAAEAVGTEDEMPRELLATHRLQGAGVKNAAGEDIGTISQFLFDSMSGRIHFAVISTGGFLGLGQLEIPVPWRALNMQTVEGEEKLFFTLNATKEQLEKAPQFHADRADEFNTATKLDAVYTYWGVERPLMERVKGKVQDRLRALDDAGKATPALPETTKPNE